MSKNDLLTRCRILTVHIIYCFYSAVLWWYLIEIARKSHHPLLQILIPCIIWACFFLVSTIKICFAAFSETPSKWLLKTWINVPMLVFAIFNLPPYGYTLNEMYKSLKVTQKESIYRKLNFTSSFENNDNLPIGDFIFLQMAIPVLMLTFIIYPLPKRAYTSSEYLALAVGFMNAFDIMDIVPDIAFILNYELIWFVIFYMSLGISVFLLSFPIKIETEDIVWPTKVVCSNSTVEDGFEVPCFFAVKDQDYNSRRKLSIISRTNDHAFSEVDFAMISNNVNSSYSDELDLTNDNNKDSTTNEISFNHQQKKAYDLKLAKMTSKKNETKKEKEFQARFTLPVMRKVIKALFTVIIMDGMFAAIRLKIMVTEQSAEYGFNMIVKNCVLAGLHLIYLIKHLKSFILLNYFKKRSSSNKVTK